MSGDEGRDLVFDPEALANVTQGLGDTIDQLGDSTGSVMGKGFTQRAMTGTAAEGWADVESNVSSP
ncbi:hypothetical protein ACFCX0_20095 [Streptomyces sp. NPDC056352]|uniref:hypothetical protein n=1 Tax=Streptomyces sp. NPDC056352 TaxID=3345791 RepID=UPI0035DFFCF2